MTCIAYIEKNFSNTSLSIIAHASGIIEEYKQQGFILTLRQLYYQFVARDLIANDQRQYKRLGSIINDARLTGLISWTAVEDFTRNVQRNAHWSSPRELLRAARDSYATEKWKSQPYRVEVWIEKDALTGVIAPVCEELDVPYTSCRGYYSQSEQWRAGQRFKGYIAAGQTPVVLHLGDHDPSGIDMTRDNRERLSLFARTPVEVRRLALNYDQIEEFHPPPNPAKVTDSRIAGYVAQYGTETWELDALEPTIIARLIREAVAEIRDDSLWVQALGIQEKDRAHLSEFCEQLGDE